jgi:hypothetical protein
MDESTNKLRATITKIETKFFMHFTSFFLFHSCRAGMYHSFSRFPLEFTPAKVGAGMTLLPSFPVIGATQG